MWIVSIHRPFYPLILTYDDYEEAVEEYEEKSVYYQHHRWVNVYLSEVIEPF